MNSNLNYLNSNRFELFRNRSIKKGKYTRKTKPNPASPKPKWQPNPIPKTTQPSWPNPLPHGPSCSLSPRPSPAPTRRPTSSPRFGPARSLSFSSPRPALRPAQPSGPASAAPTLAQLLSSLPHASRGPSPRTPLGPLQPLATPEAQRTNARLPLRA